MPLVILDADGAGTLDGLMEAIRYAVSHGASIINLSLAGLDYDEQLDHLMRRAALAMSPSSPPPGMTDAASQG